MPRAVTLTANVCDSESQQFQVCRALETDAYGWFRVDPDDFGPPHATGRFTRFISSSTLMPICSALAACWLKGSRTSIVATSPRRVADGVIDWTRQRVHTSWEFSR